MSNYSDSNLISIPASSVPVGTLAMKVGDNVFTAGYVNIVSGADVTSVTATASDVLSGKLFVDSAGNTVSGGIQTVTPQVNGNAVTISQGYIASSSFNVGTSKAAQTYTPTTSNQIISAGIYLGGSQTILGDANLVAENIASGVSIFGVSGTHQGGGGGAASDSSTDDRVEYIPTSVSVKKYASGVVVSGFPPVTISGVSTDINGEYQEVPAEYEYDSSYYKHPDLNVYYYKIQDMIPKIGPQVWQESPVYFGKDWEEVGQDWDLGPWRDANGNACSDASVEEGTITLGSDMWIGHRVQNGQSDSYVTTNIAPGVEVTTVDALQPLTFTAAGAASTVAISNPPSVGQTYYRQGTSGPWIVYTAGTTINLAAGESCQFKRNADTYLYYNSTKFSTTGGVYANGNIQAMLNFSDTVPSQGFMQLFKNNSGLIKAPQMPATTFVGANNYRGIYSGCSNLKYGPSILPAEQVRGYSYYDMFSNCPSLITAPIIKARALVGTNDPAMYRMFYGCAALKTPPPYLAVSYAAREANHMQQIFAGSGITQIPRIYADTLVTRMDYAFKDCTSLKQAQLPFTGYIHYYLTDFFYGCTSLNRIQVSFTSWLTSYQTDEGYFNNWVYNVAPTGTFIKPSALPQEYGANRIPSGWTVINK